MGDGKKRPGVLGQEILDELAEEEAELAEWPEDIRGEARLAFATKRNIRAAIAPITAALRNAEIPFTIAFSVSIRTRDEDVTVNDFGMEGDLSDAICGMEHGIEQCRALAWAKAAN